MQVYWQIAYKCAALWKVFGKFSFLFTFSFTGWEREENPFFSRHKFSYFISFPYWVLPGSAFFSFLPFCSLCITGVLEKFSINTLTVAFERTFFIFLHPRRRRLKLHYQYRMRGLTDFARTAPIGKKNYWKFSIGWRLLSHRFVYFSRRSQSLFRFLCLDQSFSVRFLPISILR